MHKNNFRITETAEIKIMQLFDLQMLAAQGKKFKKCTYILHIIVLVTALSRDASEIDHLCTLKIAITQTKNL